MTSWSCPVRVDISKRVGRVKLFVVPVLFWSLPSERPSRLSSGCVITTTERCATHLFEPRWGS